MHDEAVIEAQQRQRRRHKRLDAHRDYIVSLPGQFPNLSAVKVLHKLNQKHPEL